MNNPIAWMREDGVIAFHAQKEVDSQGYKWQPLYTHPAELTDEDIANIWAEHTKIGGTYDVKDIVFPFAKAILRKAQEK